MNLFVIIEEFSDFERVKFYTAKIEDEENEETESETDEFISRFDDEENKHFEELLILLNSIEEIGKRGALQRYFRPEESAEALPSPKGTNLGIIIPANTQLRLYCIRINDEIVILLNGGVKTENTAQDCPNISSYFRFANSLSKKITQLIITKDITIKEKELLGELEFYL